MDKQKLLLPVTVLLGCIILGGVYYDVELNKQHSIERQQQLDLQQKQADQKAKDVSDKVKAEQEQAQAQQDQTNKDAPRQRYNDCMAKADATLKDMSNSLCLEKGFTQADVDAQKCKLTNGDAELLMEANTKMQNNCKDMYKLGL